MAEKARESLGSRLGFIFLSAGCAIGLGNVWRFPYITGKYGGAAFVLIYLFFLVFFALPVMVMEFTVGRASRQSVVKSFPVLVPGVKPWGIVGYFMLAGNYILMMFYTVISGWMLAYVWFTASGQLSGLDPAGVGGFFGGFVGNPVALVSWLLLVVLLASLICGGGLQAGVERITKIMMGALLIVMLLLALRSVTLPGSEKGLEFYLKPDIGRLMENGLWNSIYAAMGQAFFTLSLGIGSMAIFGSYISRERSLTGESIVVTVLDTFVALTAGLIIFPACFAYNVDVNSGPGLVFVTLPNMFNNMPGGRLWSSLFFVFMSFAAMTTVVAVFEHLIANLIDVLGMERRKATILNFFLVFFLAIPCALGFNIWGHIAPLGQGTIILDLEDFIVSNNLLPLGSIAYMIFCTTRYGWGWDNFIKEADMGKGIKFPQVFRAYVTFVIPAIMMVVFVMGYVDLFSKK